MRLKSLAFVTAALLGVGQAQAQGVSYDPPPVDYAGPSAVPSAPGEPQAGEAPSSARDRSTRQRPRVDVSASLEVQQVLSTELSGGSGGDDVLTYTSVAAGVEGQIVTRRVTASVGYRYERRFDIVGDVADDDVHTGIAQVGAELVPGTLRVDAGALATRTGGAGRALGVTDREPATEIYSGYAGPSLSGRAGPVALNASYRLGYTRVDDDSLAGVRAAEGNFNSTVHSVTGSAGVAPGRGLPVGVTVAGGYVREEAGSLDNRFEARFVRADVVAPLGPTLAATAGVGYSSTRASQSDVQRGANGAPVRDARGRFVPDRARPRLLTYDVDGIFYDAGVIWRPNPRTEVQVRAGADEEGSFTVAGSAGVRFNRSFGATVSVFDQRTTFGQSILNNLRNLPQEFDIRSNPLTGELFGGCVFGDRPGQGVCLAPALNSITNLAFRARGANLVVSGTRRFWTVGGGVSYTHRDYYLPDDPLFVSALASGDQDLSLFASASRQLGRNASLSFDSYASWYDSERAGFDSVFSAGATVSFSRAFLLERLQLLVALGIAHTTILGDDSSVANGLIGLRYTF